MAHPLRSEEVAARSYLKVLEKGGAAGEAVRQLAVAEIEIAIQVWQVSCTPRPERIICKIKLWNH